jgi:hypothetical protein
MIRAGFHFYAFHFFKAITFCIFTAHQNVFFPSKFHRMYGREALHFARYTRILSRYPPLSHPTPPSMFYDTGPWSNIECHFRITMIRASFHFYTFHFFKAIAFCIFTAHQNVFFTSKFHRMYGCEALHFAWHTRILSRYPPSLFFYHFLQISVLLTFSPSLFLTVPFSISLSLCIFLSVSFSQCLSHCVFLNVSFSMCLSQYVLLNVSFPICLSHCVFLNVSSSICLSHYVFLTVSFSFTVSHFLLLTFSFPFSLSHSYLVILSFSFSLGYSLFLILTWLFSLSHSYMLIFYFSISV